MRVTGLARDHRATDTIRHSAEALPQEIPAGHVGPVMLRGTGRLVWWTGRVAIGLRHQPQRSPDMSSSSALWIQDLMLSSVAARG